MTGTAYTVKLNDMLSIPAGIELFCVCRFDSRGERYSPLGTIPAEEAVRAVCRTHTALYFYGHIALKG